MSLKRKLTLAGLVLLALLFWPWFDNPLNYLKWEDRVRTSLPVALAFGFPCETREDGAIYIDRSPACLRFGESREFRGVWLYAFEGSTFIEGATTAPVKRPPYEDVSWLNFDLIESDPKFDAYDENKRCYRIAAYRVRFIGRKRTGSGGHLGLWGSEIWPSRMIDVEQIKGPDCNTYHAS